MQYYNNNSMISDIKCKYYCPFPLKLLKYNSELSQILLEQHKQKLKYLLLLQYRWNQPNYEI